MTSVGWDNWNWKFSIIGTKTRKYCINFSPQYRVPVFGHRTSPIIYFKKYLANFKLWPINGQLLVYKPIWQCFYMYIYLICDIMIFKNNIQIFWKIYRFSYRFLIKNTIFWSRYTDFSKFQVVRSAHDKNRSISP